METNQEIAARAVDMLQDAFPQWPASKFRAEALIKLGEEAGEAQGAGLRYLGMTRRSGTRDELAEELSDVVITAYRAAHVFGIDLDAAIQAKSKIVFARGFRDASPAQGGAVEANTRYEMTGELRYGGGASAELEEQAVTQVMPRVPGEVTQEIRRPCLHPDVIIGVEMCPRCVLRT